MGVEAGDLKSGGDGVSSKMDYSGDKETGGGDNCFSKQKRRDGATTYIFEIIEGISQERELLERQIEKTRKN